MAYHIKKDGTPGVCHAKPGNCPLGGEGEHFNTIEQAQEFADKSMENNYSLLGKSPVQMSTAEFQEHVLSIDESEVEAELAILNSELEHIKGISRIQTLRKARVAEAALKGVNLLEKEAAKKLQVEKENQERIAIENNNALNIKNSKNLDVPNAFKRYIVDKQWSRANINAYRGELDPSERVENGNTGMALYGRGVYSTTDKSYAKKYGDVRNADVNELPVTPLWVDNATNFNQLEYELAEEFGTTKTAINSTLELEEIVIKMGYDGVVVGEGKDMLIVNFNTERNAHLFKERN